MRNVLLTAGLVVAIFLSFVTQEFVPSIAMAEGARLVLFPVFFCYGACVLPFPGMLVLAVTAGFLNDFINLQVVHEALDVQRLDAVGGVAGSVELSAGWTILLLVALGSLCQGVRPLVLRGHWWLPPVLSALTTIVFLAAQFVGITARRFEVGGLVWNDVVLWRILLPGLLASGLTLVVVMLGLLLPAPGHRHTGRDF